MIMEVTGSIQKQCEQRLNNLHIQSHEWLLKASYNICKSYEESEDLVSDLYLYLHRKGSKKIFYANSYNLIYCLQFLKHRWFNRVSKLKRYKYTPDNSHFEDILEEYDEDKDNKISEAYNEVMQELKRLSISKNWAQAKLFELYWCSDDTLNEVAEKIGISKSTVFLSIKKIRLHMKNNIQNPFN